MCSREKLLSVMMNSTGYRRNSVLVYEIRFKSLTPQSIYAKSTGEVPVEAFLSWRFYSFTPM